MLKWQHFFPRTIYGQMVALVSLCMFMTLGVTSLLLYAFRPLVPPPLPPGPFTNILAVETGIQALQAAPPAVRANIAEKMSGAEVTFVIGKDAACQHVPTDHMATFIRNMLVYRGNLGPYPIDAQSCAPQVGEGLLASLYLPHDNISVIVFDRHPHHFGHMMRWTMPLTISLLSLVTIALALTFWSIWHLSRPLRNIAIQADAFGYDSTPEPLPQQGPTEVRRLTHAFNRMQARIAASTEERTRMLIAIGHDLRTPLTRLFIRLELGGEEASPAAMKHDLTLMKKMLNGALHFLREQTDAETAQEIDLASQLETLCHEFSVVGHTISYTGPAYQTCICQPIALERALSNLIENGLKYGKEVEIRLGHDSQYAVIDICDNGPGIPAHLLEKARLPFSRLDPARSLDGGLGLGLSIADAIISRNKGQLTLGAAHPHGLCARVKLPLAAQQRKKTLAEKA
ncbi:MAG: ATP-binding protein [Acetobacter sp.]|uniref:ATP-binding protein n=1 Tax=Acetobacter sp. TaxID=440 RepID=UPI003F908A56